MILILLMVSTLKSCAQNNIDADLSKVVYSTISRGSYYRIELKNNNIIVENDREAMGKIDKILDRKSWEEVRDILKIIDLNEIHKLKPLSNDNFTDRAAIGSIEVTTSSKTYVSASFDHGSPPLELKPLIDKILALAKSVE